MRIHYLQHVPFEDLANIEVWADMKGHSVSGTSLSDGERLPAVSGFDWLIVMGGPMGVHDEERYPWLVREKEFISETIDAGKAVLGICLGAQLIADVLGADVRRNRHREIGWLPVSLTAEARRSRTFGKLPDRFMAFHWHGDTFDIPSRCMRTAESEGCENQAFECNGGRVVGLQFHLESSPKSVWELIKNCGGDMVEGEYVQDAETMLSYDDGFREIRSTMTILLDSMEEAVELR